MILFSIKYIKSNIFIIKKTKSIYNNIFFYNITFTLNPYIDYPNKLLIKINLDSIKSLEEKQRSLIYSDILENLEKVNENDSSTSFALNVEIDRAIHSGEMIVSRIINYHLHFESLPFLPSSAIFSQMGTFSLSYLYFVLLASVNLVAELETKNLFMFTFFVSSFILA